MFFIFSPERVKLIFHYGKNDRKGLDMNDNIYELLRTVVSRTEYINNWWKANPSKEELSEDDEGLLSSQLEELEYEIKKLETKVNEVRNIIG